MSKAPGELASPKEGSTNEQHVVAAHADSKLLSGHVEKGELRAADSAAFQKFRSAAKKVVVTNEVCDALSQYVCRGHLAWCLHGTCFVVALPQSH